MQVDFFGGMADGGTLSVHSGKIACGFRKALASAALEWLLIFMLFLDAIFSYLITKFADHYKLQTPCLLCSRLDHVLGSSKNMKFYLDLICDRHKSEISSLVYCHAHGKLADVHEICENCLFSFATVNKSNTETYRLLVGKLGENFDHGPDDDALLDGHNHGHSSTRHCSCCNDKWSLKGYAERLMRMPSVACEASELGVALTGPVECKEDEQKTGDDPSVSVRAISCDKSEPHPLSPFGYSELKITSDTESKISDDDKSGALTLTREIEDLKHDIAVEYAQPERETNLSDDFASEKLMQMPLIHCEAAELVVPLTSPVEWEQDKQKIRNDPSVSVRAIGPLSHIGYSELKITSDTESEISDYNNDDKSSAQIRETGDIKHGIAVEYVQPEPRFINLSDDFASEKLISPALPLLVSEERPDFVNPLGGTSVEFSETIGHGLEELNWQPTSGKIDSSVIPELISLDDISQTSNVGDPPVSISIFTDDVPSSPNTGIFPSHFQVSTESKVRDDFLPSSISSKTPMEALIEEKLTSMVGNPAIEASKHGCCTCNVEVQGVALMDSEESGKARVGQITNNHTPGETDNNPSDGSIPAPSLLELSDAYKLAVGSRGRQLSGKLANHWLGKDSSKLSEDLRNLFSQLSSSRSIEQVIYDMSPRLSMNGDEMKALDSGMHLLQKMASLERNESGLSLDGSVVSEIEGESVNDRLKRQVEHDKKLLNAMYKELEEERNASAVAANQAMAMITRLQEEKATLHLEALHNIRMMEEQAEYDMEALQKTNDLLAEKEKEIQDLEAELEYYRKKFPSEQILEDIADHAYGLKTKEINGNCTDVHFIEESDNPDLCSNFAETDTSYMTNGDMKASSLEPEDERLDNLQES